MGEQLTAEHFIPYLNGVFRVEGGRHALTLARVDATPIGDRQAQSLLRQPFTLIFCGPPGDVLAEGLHTLAAEDGRPFTLYLIPIQTREAERQDYQAVFN
jgi:hypothetical protein